MRFAALAAVAVLLLAGCSATVTLTPGAHAVSARCAGVIVRLPTTVGAAEERTTDAQGTAAWGSPVAVTLRCGVPRPGVSTNCYSYGGVDWVVADQTLDRQKVQVLTTFDRDPVVQVVVDSDTAQSVSINDVLPPVSDAIAAAIPRTATRCTSHASATVSP